MKETIKEDAVIMKQSLLYCWACSRLNEQETLEWVQDNMPAGTSNNWQLCNYEERPDCKPVKCADYEGRMHYQFEC